MESLPFQRLILLAAVIGLVHPQGAYYPNHYYGANQGNIRSGIVPEFDTLPEPVKRVGLHAFSVPDWENPATLAPHVCGFNTFSRKCMDPEGHCPGRCMNFAYTFNVIYDCRCLVIKK